MSGLSPEQPIKLDDLDQINLKASEAFLAMGKFLLAYFERTHGKGNLATICSDVAIEQDRMSVDPAALSSVCMQSWETLKTSLRQVGDSKA
jgi:hypothetical protein